MTQPTPTKTPRPAPDPPPKRDPPATAAPQFSGGRQPSRNTTSDPSIKNR